MSDSNVAIQRLTDELEILNLMNRFAMLNDVGDLDEYIACWTEDARAELRKGTPLQGRAEIRAGFGELRAAGVSGPGTHRRHVNTTQVVRFDGPDSATCEYYSLLFVADPTRSPAGTPVTPPVTRNLTHSRTVLQRTPDGWKVKETQTVS